MMKVCVCVCVCLGIFCLEMITHLEGMCVLNEGEEEKNVKNTKKEKKYHFA